MTMVDVFENLPILSAYPCSGASEGSSAMTIGNAKPILHEIGHAVARLLEDGQEAVIDLRAMPFGPDDEKKLEEVLGRGDVEASVKVVGRSSVRETGVSGVWIVEHFDDGGRVLSKFIEVTFVPSILKALQEDVEDGLRALSARLFHLAEADREKGNCHAERPYTGRGA